MNYEQVKQAFLKADDLAQKGDKQAFEDAKVFAQYLQNYKSEEKKKEYSPAKSFLGGAAAIGDFAANMIQDIPAGLAGLAKGTVAGVREGSFDKFIEEGAKAIEKTREVFPRNPFAKMLGVEDNTGYQTAEQVLAIPGELGVKSIRGLQALSKIPTKGLEGAAQYLEEPFRDPLAATVSDVVGPFLGYGLAGRGVSKVAGATVRPEYVKPEPLPGYNPNVSPFPEKPTARTTLVDPEIVRKEGLDVVEDQAINPYAQSGDLFPGEDLARYQAEADAQATAWQDTREAQRTQPATPLEYGLTLEDKPTRGELREAERDAIYEGRKEFPTVDIELLPERVAKDTVIKGQITRWNNLQGKLRGLYQQANELGISGTQIIGNQFRPNELGLSASAKNKINALVPEIKKLEAQLNNISSQIQTRMTNKHNIDVEGLPLFKGVIGKEKGKYANEPVDMTPPTTGQTPLNIEKTVAPNMQRSSDVKVTGTEMVQKTTRPALGGTGKKGFKQGGGFDPTIIEAGVDKVKELTKKLDESLNKINEALSKINIHKRDIEEDLELFSDSPTMAGVIAQELKAYGYPKEVWGEMLEYGKLYQKLKEETQSREIIKNFDPEERKFYNQIELAKGKVEYLENKIEQLKNEHNLQYEENKRWKDYSRSQQYWMKQILKLEDKIENLKELYIRNDPHGEYQTIENFGRRSFNNEWNHPLHPRFLLDKMYEEGELNIPKEKKLNKGTFKQSGGVNFGISDKINDLLNKTRTKQKPPQGTKPSKTSPASVYTLEDTRDFNTFWEQESPKASTWTDIPDNMLSNLYRGITQGKFVATMSKRMNPILSFATSKIVSMDRLANVNKENALWGNQFVSNLRGWGKRVKSSDGALTYWEAANRADAGKLLDVLLKYDGSDTLLTNGLKRPTEDMLTSEGLNKDQIKAANSLYDSIDKIFSRINELRQKEGMEPINQIPGYIPHMWFGDYRVIVKDKTTGETLSVVGVNNKYQLNSIMEKSRQLFQDENKYKIESFDARKGKYNMNDISAFQYALGVIQKNTKEHQILSRAYKDILGHRGFNKHGLQRKGVKGFAGSEGGTIGVPEFSKGVEAYINQGYNFIANQEKRLLLRDMKEKLSETREQGIDLSKTEQYLEDYVKNSTGSLKNQLEFLENYIFEPAGELSRFGPSAVREGIKNINSLASGFFLTSGKFLLVNLMQPMYNIGKLRNIAIDFPTGKGAIRTFGQAYLETFMGKASSKTKAGLNYAKQNGFIDAKTLELLDSKLTRSSLANQSLFKISRYSLGWWEQEAVRTPTFVMYDLMLRDVIKNDKQRWDTAGALTDQYMVDYGKTESPAFYSEMGTVGEAIRPLKQYGHAYAGQIGELLQLAKEDKQYTPLVGFLGTQITLGGLKGMVGIGIANSLVNYINNNFGTSLQSPEDWLLSSGMSSSMVYGPVSTVTGLDISGSVSAPGVEDIFTAPGLEAAGKSFAEGTQFLGKAARGTVTEMDQMRLLQRAIPNPHAKAMIEQLYTPEGEPPPDPNSRGLPATMTPRTPTEAAARVFTGAELTREQQEKAMLRGMKAEETKKSAAKREIMSKMVDDIYRGGELDTALLDKYVEKGGDPSNLVPEIKSFVKEKLMGQLRNQVLKGSALSKAQKIEKLEEYDRILQNAELEDLINLYKEDM